MPRHEKRIHRRNFEFSEAADRKNWSPIGINRRRKLPKKDVTFGKQFSRFESEEADPVVEIQTGIVLWRGRASLPKLCPPPSADFTA